MSVTENDIINNAAAIAELVNAGQPGVEIDDLDAVTIIGADDPLHVQESGVDKKILARNTGIYPSVQAMTIGGTAENIDLSAYQRNINFTITIGLAALFYFSNMVEGQGGTIKFKQNGIIKYSLGYLGTYYGDTIEAPEIGDYSVYGFYTTNIGGSIVPVFGAKKNLITS